jgi:hypothetical protein
MGFWKKLFGIPDLPTTEATETRGVPAGPNARDGGIEKNDQKSELVKLAKATFLMASKAGDLPAAESALDVLVQVDVMALRDPEIRIILSKPPMDVLFLPAINKSVYRSVEKTKDPQLMEFLLRTSARLGIDAGRSTQ